MADYLHGAYGQIQAVGTKVAIKSQNAIVYGWYRPRAYRCRWRCQREPSHSCDQHCGGPQVFWLQRRVGQVYPVRSDARPS